MKKVLVINTVDFAKGGISSVIMNYYEHMDLAQFRVDFVVNRNIDSDYKSCINKKGSNIFILDRNRNPLKYMFLLYKILKKEAYDVVHIHGNSATMLIDTVPAVLAGVKNRIVHCHNTKCSYPAVSEILNVLFHRTYTKALACSKAAGDWLFGEGNFDILPNGIDIEKYRFSGETRKNIREELGLKDKFVIGHVGFMNEQKNHEKLLAVFAELKKKKKNAHLLCVTGNSFVPAHIQKLIREYGIEKDVTVLFQRRDVDRLLQAMDFFVFPSKWEGFPVTLLEAQASGLLCLVSDVVPKEVNMTNNITYYSLKKDNRDWAEFIYKSKLNNSVIRQEMNEVVKKTEFNIVNCANKLLKIYTI